MWIHIIMNCVRVTLALVGQCINAARHVTIPQRRKPGGTNDPTCPTGGQASSSSDTIFSLESYYISDDKSPCQSSRDSSACLWRERTQGTEKHFLVRKYTPMKKGCCCITKTKRFFDKKCSFAAKTCCSGREIDRGAPNRTRVQQCWQKRLEQNCLDTNENTLRSDAFVNKPLCTFDK